MNLQQAYQFLNFWIDKVTGSYYSPEELDLLVDRGQMALFDDLRAKYGTSDEITTALAPFKTKYLFGHGTSPGGVVSLPTSGADQFHTFLDIYVTVQDEEGNVSNYPVLFPNEDERTNRLRSQIDPVTITDPIGEWIGIGQIQLYPKIPQAGVVTYFRRPVAPHFAYTVQGGRIIVYDPDNSVQLEWLEKDQNAVLLKALESIGINLGNEHIMTWSQRKTTENFQGVNRT